MLTKSSKKRIVYLISLVGLLIVLFCILYKYNGGSNSPDKNDENIKIGIIFTGSGLGDKSFNDLAYDGLVMAQKDLGIEFDYLEPRYEEEYEGSVREYAKSGKYELIIAIGPEQEEAIKVVATEFPKQKFTLLDSKLELPNVSSIYTNWAEQTFLDGVIAGLETSNSKDRQLEKPVAGVVLGMDVNHLREGAVGFEAGFRYINNDSKVIVATINDYTNQSKARETALLMYSNGVKYIQHIAGSSGLGVFAAAKETDNYAFGVDANQNFIEPNNIVATSTRYINEIIYNEIKAIYDNRWIDGVHLSGFKEGVVDVTTEGSKVKLADNTVKNLKKIKQDLIDGKISIPSDKNELDRWLEQNKWNEFE